MGFNSDITILETQWYPMTTITNLNGFFSMPNSLHRLLKYLLDCNNNSIMLLGRLRHFHKKKKKNRNKKLLDTMDKAESYLKEKNAVMWRNSSICLDTYEVI